MIHLLILFLTLFSNEFANTVTVYNSHNQFDINKVVFIGTIKIDHLFKQYVYSHLGSYTVCGTTLQAMIVDYAMDLHNIKPRTLKSFYIKQLSNIKYDGVHISINDLNIYLENVQTFIIINKF